MATFTNDDARKYACESARTNDELIAQYAGNGLPLPIPGTRHELLTAILTHLGTLNAADPAAWVPTSGTTATTTTSGTVTTTGTTATPPSEGKGQRLASEALDFWHMVRHGRPRPKS